MKQLTTNTTPQPTVQETAHLEPQPEPKYSALAVANHLIRRANEDRIHLDPLKLQKLLYFAHGWHLAHTGVPLINERIEAWKYGPVVPSIYYTFRARGRDPIREPVTVTHEGRRFVPIVRHDDTQTHAFLDEILRVLGRYTGVELSALAHRQNSPWDQVWKGEAQEGKIHGVDIKDTAIKAYFEHLQEQGLHG